MHLQFLMILVAVFALDDFHRAKIVTGMELGLDLVAYNFFGYLSFPTNSNRNFPFHVKANQVNKQDSK